MTFRQVADCLPADLKKRLASKDHKPRVIDPNTAFAVHTFSADDEKGSDVIAMDISGVEAMNILREAISDSSVASAYATRDRGDGTAQILYLCEMEERFQPVD